MRSRKFNYTATHARRRDQHQNTTNAKKESNSNENQSGARGVLASVALSGAADAAGGADQYAGQIPSPAGHWTRQLMYCSPSPVFLVNTEELNVLSR